MRPITDILKTNQWAGQRAFVVGSGASLRGFDHSLLKDELTIGCNEEYRWGPTVGICQDVRFFFGDGSRAPAKDNPAWYNGKHIPVFFKGHPDRPDPHWYNEKIYTIQAATGLPRTVEGGVRYVWGKTLEEGLAYGAVTGLAALNLADVLGASPIYLLGFDCKEAPDGETHCHDHYPASWKMKNAGAQHNRGTFAYWVQEFEKWAPYVRGWVIVVGDSALRGTFPGTAELWSLARGLKKGTWV